MTPTGSEAHCYVTLRGRILCVTVTRIFSCWIERS